jgi:glycerophosphoryl diester phosphodiesterase
MLLKIAHRGASQYAPENTLRAFAAAIELGADMIELDVHLTADGVPVVIHDASLERLTDGRGAVSATTLPEIKALRVLGAEPIPTLQEAIDFVNGRCGLYIELKGAGTPGPVVDAIRRNNLVATAIVGSFRGDLVRAVADLAPEIRTSILTHDVAADFVALARAAHARFVHLCFENAVPQPHTLLTPELLAGLRAAGLGILIWHEERPAEIAALMQLDIDGICSNAPDLLTQFHPH